MTTPSIVHTASCGRVPFDWKLDCCPVSLPAMLTRSTITPGTVRSSAHGSREVGTLASSACVKFVAVPVDLGSTIGDSAVTLTLCSTEASLSEKGTSEFTPTRTSIRSRTVLAKPVRLAVTVYMPGGRFKNRYLPSVPVVAVCVRSDPLSVTTAPGSTAPCSSTTVP